MFVVGQQNGSRPKCDFINAALPTFVNHEQPSTKKRPFLTILGQTLSHTVHPTFRTNGITLLTMFQLDVVLPEAAAANLRQALANNNGTLRYARVHMKLDEIIEGDFFNHYVKSGNIVMLAEGRSGLDHVFSLADGLLHLEVDRATYERMGLEGKAIRSEGRKHVKARFAIDINLRLPAMVHGKKGFERVVWAFKNVLNSSVTWLFYDLNAPNDGTGPISIYQPALRSVDPETVEMANVSVPTFPTDLSQDDSLDATELLEWLSLVCNVSNRLQNDDKIDRYLCRYDTPRLTTDDNGGSSLTTQNLVRFHWHGFMPHTFITKILLSVIKASGDDWFAVSAASFTGHAYTILRVGEESMTWEYAE